MKAILTTLAGACLGAVSSIAVYILGFCFELLNCACQIISCNFDGGSLFPAMWDEGGFWSVFLFCTIAGAVIGLIYGICMMILERNEEARCRAAADAEAAKKQRIKWAGEVKQKALSVANICEKNAKEYKAPVSPNYKANSQMDVIMKELANVAELKGKVDAMANDTKTKGGVSK